MQLLAKFAGAVTLLASVGLCMAQAPVADAPSHERPYFMPKEERLRILGLLKNEDWAKQEMDRMKAAAEKGDGYSAAFVYALTGNGHYLPAAQKMLLGRYGPKAYWINQASKRLADPSFFKTGQPGIPEVYYDIDIAGMVAFDWVYNGLDPADRKVIAGGIATWARYKMRCMDRWTQTPNLVFKPTYTVAFAGMATQEPELLAWGFRRTKPYGGGLGGYFEVLNSMLKDGGPWHEAPIYPGAHTGLFIVSTMSHYRRLYDGKDWFRTPVANGGTPKGLMDYYIDSAYPIERTGHGPGQVRVANYGDGSTNARGDLILVNPAAADGNVVLQEPLIAAYNASGDTRYAPFVAMIPGYQANLIDRRPLPRGTELPAAPSKVWPTYGLAMLRSDESPGYWTSGKAIAVFQLMSQGYGHDHRDKFSISLHGANRLFYPNYNAIQYENPAIGWTRNSVSHNTLVVDEGETRNAVPTGIRHEFTPEVKFLATSATGVFEGVDQTRALFLTQEYLLDIFQAASATPHTYDYLLHSFGQAQPAQPEKFAPSKALIRRYWLVDNQKALTTDDSWSLDFVIKEEPGSKKGNYGKEWYEHTARLRLTMAAEPKTQVVHGVWGNELARLVAERQKDARLDRLAMVAARREGKRKSVFVATHEPYANAEKPKVAQVEVLSKTAEAVLVRVTGRDFTDYAAVAFGPQKEGPEHSLLVAANNKPASLIAFKGHTYLRVNPQGAVTARGGLTRLELPGAKGSLTLNGKPVDTKLRKGSLVYGNVPEVLPIGGPEMAALESPLSVKIAPSVVRVFDRDRRTMTFTVQNPLKEAVSGQLEFDLPEGLSVEPAKPVFGPIAAGASGMASVTFVSDRPAAGRHTVPYRVVYRPAGSEKDIRTGAHPVVVMVGPTLEHVYEYPKPYFLVQAPKYTARLDMFHGLCRFLADDSDAVRLDGPLFTFSDGKMDLLTDKTERAFTWPREAPASLVAHAYDRCRWQALFFGDRILFRMDPGWTQFETTHFTIPGKWVSPGGTPKWRRIVSVATGGKEADVAPGPTVRMSAAALEFPGAKWDLAFKFEPPQEVTFNGTEMKFRLGSLNNDAWSIGFCEPARFDGWRGKK